MNSYQILNQPKPSADFEVLEEEEEEEEIDELAEDDFIPIFYHPLDPPPPTIFESSPTLSTSEMTSNVILESRLKGLFLLLPLLSLVSLA